MTTVSPAVFGVGHRRWRRKLFRIKSIPQPCIKIMMEIANHSVAIAGMGNRCVFNGLTEEYSPHTRGWTVVHNALHITGVVFPAYAGMDREFVLRKKLPICIPRIRGDGPRILSEIGGIIEYSPHTRGWTGLFHVWFGPWHVFPTDVGIDRLPSIACRTSGCLRALERSDPC